MTNVSNESLITKPKSIRKPKQNPDVKHGFSRTRVYSIYKKMKERCYSPTCDSYKYYGERGITICDEWLNDYTTFHTWALANGYADNLSIDRVNTDGDYTPLNCRWATPKEQGNNRRDCRYVTIDGVTKSFTDWCEFYNIAVSTARGRLSTGWDDHRALTTPLMR